MTNVSITRDDMTGEGSMLVAPDSTHEEISAAHREIESSGWTILEYEETGDLYDYDDAGNMVVPLAWSRETVMARETTPAH